MYLTFYKIETAVTRNLIGTKIISNIKHSHTRNINSFPTVTFVMVDWIGQKKIILIVIRTSHKRCVLQMNATSKVRCLLHVLEVPSHFLKEYRYEANLG